MIDPQKKDKNDRTWCFWSKEQDFFDDILFKKWNQIIFASSDFEKKYEISPYSYKMLRGIDFYNKVVPFLQDDPLTEFIHYPIDSIHSEGNLVKVNAGGQEYEAEFVFKSYYDKIDFSKDHFVWQHFKGLIIETEDATFDPDTATFMDFRVDQEDETRFFYVLPFSEKKALVEIAIFSGDIPDSEFYDGFIQDYIEKQLKIKSYKIEETELGAIPMTTHDFQSKRQDRVIQIGTGGGSVKASSGYAFKRIQDETDNLVQFVINRNLKDYRFKTNRFHFYDRILLNAILSHKTSGEKVFDSLFKKLSPQTIFKFLDEQGSVLHDFKIFSAPPTIPFFRAFVEELVKK